MGLGDITQGEPGTPAQSVALVSGGTSEKPHFGESLGSTLTPGLSSSPAPDRAIAIAGVHGSLSSLPTGFPAAQLPGPLHAPSRGPDLGPGTGNGPFCSRARLRGARADSRVAIIYVHIPRPPESQCREGVRRWQGRAVDWDPSGDTERSSRVRGASGYVASRLWGPHCTQSQPGSQC